MDHAGDAHAEEEGHEFPATTDWPRGFGEASWWPFVAAVGVGGIYLGAALAVLGRIADSPITVVPGLVVAGAGVVGFVVGLLGWLYHAFVADFWSRHVDADAATTLRVTMVLFLVSEVMTFSAGFVYYFFVRTNAVWRPDLLPSGGVTGPLVFVNTAILVASSVTLHYANESLEDGHRRRFVRRLALTLLLGVVFIGGQIYEYYEFLVAEGFGLAEGAYASAFYGLTGLHGLHVTLGAVILAIVLARAMRGQYAPDRRTSVTTATMYWHFVDVVWIALVVVVYLTASLTF